MAAKNKKVIPYRRFRFKRPNIGMIIFIIMFVYMCFSISTYLSRDRISFYEVVDGGMVNDTSHTGIIIRDENLQYSDGSGYVNCYIREGKRASVGTRIYSLDKTGNMTKFLEENSLDELTLSNENIHELKSRLSQLLINYSDNNFSDVYDAKYELQSMLMEISGLASTDSIDALMSKNGISYTQVNAPLSGVISFTVDGYEGKAETDIQASDFDKTAYTNTFTKSGQLIEQGAPVYKIIGSEDWDIIFQLNEEQKQEYADKTSLRVLFPSKNLYTSGSYSVFTGADGAEYAKLEFDKYMVQFASDRYVNFEIQTESANGLKIPRSAVIEKSFYTVPLDYIAKGGDGIDNGFYKEVYSEQGTSVEFVPAEIYNSTGEYYYLDASENAPLKAGDYIVKPDSQERFQIGQTANLEGVYNINKGYAVFKQIEVLTSNDEYYTVRKNMRYGLAVYDHILLKAEGINEGDFIYR